MSLVHFAWPLTVTGVSSNDKQLQVVFFQKKPGAFLFVFFLPVRTTVFLAVLFLLPSARIVPSFIFFFSPGAGRVVSLPRPYVFSHLFVITNPLSCCCDPPGTFFLLIHMGRSAVFLYDCLGIRVGYVQISSLLAADG